MIRRVPMKHFLLFQIKSVCYDSYTYFSNAVAKELISAGHSVEIFSLAKEPIAAMERYVGSTFDAILDFNSELSRLQMDDGTFFLDQINAPFYNVILDHPLYHHDMLKQKIKNFHILCLDENHKTYIETNYPHIASVHVSARKQQHPRKRCVILQERTTLTSGKEKVYAIR